MRRICLVSALVVCLACGDAGRGGVRKTSSGFGPATAEVSGVLPAPGEVDSLAPAGPLAPADSEQPRIVLRCEAGHLDAYLVVGTAAEAESGSLDDRGVPIRLDSALPC